MSNSSKDGLHLQSSQLHSCWLMKAEPDSRIVKGKDVKFSADDFESLVMTPWEGVRNAEARNLMKEMKIGDKVLFYHSNCKTPGIAGFAIVAKEAYPDYTAWDESHPYFDAKTDKDNPKWFMVDLKFDCRAAHFVSLDLLKRIATQESSNLTYLDENDIQAIKGMALINRGRLSVQRVEQDAWNAIEKLTRRGGWDDIVKASKGAKRTAAGTRKRQRPKEEQDLDGNADEDGAGGSTRSKTRSRKGKEQDDGFTDASTRRRSKRVKPES